MKRQTKAAVAHSEPKTSKAALADMIEALINDKPEEADIAFHTAFKIKARAILEQDEEMDDEEEEMPPEGDEESEDIEADGEECPSDDDAEDEEEDEEEPEDVGDEEVPDEEDEEPVKAESVKSYMKRPKMGNSFAGLKHKSAFKKPTKVSHKK